MDETPRMTAQDADARFEALVAQYRNEKKPRSAGRSGVALGPGFALVVVYCLGVCAGVIWHVHPFTALLIGVPLVLIARALPRRRQDTQDER
jgi:hypothetical protein